MSLRSVAIVVSVLVAVAAGREPDVIPWQAAGSHVGDFLTVEGDVVSAWSTPESCVLEFAKDDPSAFRAVLLIPMITNLPRQPERLFQGRRVRVSGRISRSLGHLEMVMRSPQQIEVVDVAGAPDEDAVAPPPPAAAAPAPSRLSEAPAPPPAKSAVAPSPAATSPPALAPAPVAAVPPAAPAAPAAASAPPPTVPPAHEPRDLVEAVAPQIARDPCPGAQARWTEAASELRARTAALDACLTRGDYRCRRESAALAPALSALEWAEQHVADACP